MLEYCKCGSVMVSGNCTNKKCSNRLEKAAVSKAAKTARSSKTSVVKTVQKSTTVPKATKCITYNISELSLKDSMKYNS